MLVDDGNQRVLLVNWVFDQLLPFSVHHVTSFVVVHFLVIVLFCLFASCGLVFVYLRIAFVSFAIGQTGVLIWTPKWTRVITGKEMKSGNRILMQHLTWDESFGFQLLNNYIKKSRTNCNLNSW